MMNTRVDNIISNIATEFHQIFDVNTSLLLFGSRANNTASQYSDIGLAIDSKGLSLIIGLILSFGVFASVESEVKAKRFKRDGDVLIDTWIGKIYVF